MKISTVFIFIYLVLRARTQTQSCPKCVNEWVNRLESREGKTIQQLLLRTIDVIKSIPIPMGPDDELKEIKQYKSRIEKIFKTLPSNLLTSLNEIDVVKINLRKIFEFLTQSTEFSPANGSARRALEIENDITILEQLLANPGSVVSNLLTPVDFALLEYKDPIYDLTKITRVIIATYWELMNGMKKNKEKQAILDRTERRIAEISSELEKLIQNITNKMEEKLQLQEKIKKKLKQLESQKEELAKTHEEALKLKGRLKKNHQNVDEINLEINKLLEDSDHYIDIIYNFCLNSTSIVEAP